MMSLHRSLVAVSLLAVSLFASSGRTSAADVDGLLPYVPMPTNALTVLRVGEILATDRAKAENWREPGKFLNGAVRIPSWVELAVQATRINPAGGRPSWAATIVPVPPPVTFDTIRAAEQAPVQELVGHQAFRSSRGYFVELKPGLIGLMRTGSRQDAALWVVQSDRGGSGMSGYLAEAARGPGHLILAFDATNMVDPKGVRTQLQASEALEGKQAEIDGATRLLPGLRGIRAALTFGATNEAEIRLDFSEAVHGLAPTMHAVFLEFLNDHGAALPELAGAKATGDGNAVILKTTLSDESVRMLVTLITAPSPEPNVPGGPAVPPAPNNTPPATNPPPQSQAVDASVAYYREVARLIRDLQNLMKSAKDYEKSATWHDNFARRIDELPVVGVDPAVATFGSNTSANFRALAASLRGTPVKVGLLGQEVTYDVQIHTDYPTGYKYGAFGGYVPGPGELQTNAPQVRAAQMKAVAQGAEDRNKIWRHITDEQNQLRNAMAAKYGVDFDKAK
jgi:hypothetical protein